jgi:hypothetical protein
MGERRAETRGETPTLRAVGAHAEELRLPRITFIGFWVEALIPLHHESDYPVLAGKRRPRCGRKSKEEAET